MKIQAAPTESGAEAALTKAIFDLCLAFLDEDIMLQAASGKEHNLRLLLNAPGILLGALGISLWHPAFLFCCGR